MSCVFALCVFSSKHGSEFPDIYSLSDFADFVSDMSWKGNCPVCFQIITIRLPLNKDGVFKRDPMIHSCINCRLKANVVTYSNTKFMRLTLATVFFVRVSRRYLVTNLPVALCAGQAAGHLCQPPRVLFILHGNVVKESKPMPHLQSPHHGREPL